MQGFQSLRRILDSNQWIPYDIGSLANCWFKPLTQPSGPLFKPFPLIAFETTHKSIAFFLICKIILHFFFKNNGCAIFIPTL